jgi:serralysin
MATYVSYAPTTTIGKALFNFDETAGLANFKYNGTVRVSVSDAFSVSDYTGTFYSNFNQYLYTGGEEIGWTSQNITNIQDILSIFSQFAGIQFDFRGDFDLPGNDSTPNPEDVGRFNLSDINITWVFRSDAPFAGVSGVSSDNIFMGYTGGAGDIFLNSWAPKFNNDFTLDLNTRARQTLMHEIGHSLGLSHSHKNVGSSLVVTNDFAATRFLGFEQLGFHIDDANDMNKEYFTIMSYDDQQSLLAGSATVFHAHTPMILDVIALQQAYGEGSGTTGAGNDTIQAGNAGYRTYFDKGGIDTIDLSAWYSDGAYLNMGVSITGASHLVGVGMSLLDAETTITFGGDPQHLRWYYGEYENAIGASGGDLIIGNVLSNVISGLAGADIIEGGGGNDALSGGDGNDRLLGEDGDDILDGGFDFDTLDGGSGVDTADYRFFNFNTTVNLIAGRVDFPPEWSAGGQFDTLISIENVLLGSANDTVHLSAANVNNLVNGNGGVDTVYVPYAYNSGYGLSGSAANLIMTGSAGVDTLLSVEFVHFGNNVTLSTVDLFAIKPHWIASVDIGPHPAGWLPTATGDYNKDGTNDVLWFNNTNHNVEVWKINNSKWAGSVDIGSHPAGWQPAASGDFNRDGTSDVLWYNPTTGNVDIWKVDNGQWAGSINVGVHPLGWRPASSGDFNNDGTSDVLWYNATNGDAEVWKLSNGQWAGSVDIGLHPLGWQPSGSGDFNHDGTSDVLWYNPTSGNVEIWKVVNGQWAGSVNVGLHPLGWSPVGTGDFNQDGTSDVVWFNATTGGVEVWLIANGQWAGSVGIGAHPLGWSPAGIGDFDHNGTSDILWREANTGRIETWLLAYS